MPGQSVFLFFRIDTQFYALPLQAVQRVLPMVEVSPLACAPEIILGVVNYHGQVLPVVDLRARLRLPRYEPEITGRLVVASTPFRTLALPVDSVEGPWELHMGRVRDAVSIHPRLDQVAGVAALEDGVVIIQDLEALLSAAEEQDLQYALEQALREVAP